MVSRDIRLIIGRCIFLVLALAPGLSAAEAHRALGDGAVLIMPREAWRRTGAFDLVVHLHGSVASVESAIAASGWDGPTIVFNRKGLSSVYAGPFADRGLFPRLLDQAQASLARDRPDWDAKFEHVLVSAFSAGFGGVRELLAEGGPWDRIEGLVLADSLYCGYASGHELDAGKMAGFRKFTALAADGKKTMVVSHSEQVPAGYASTTETAVDLIRGAGGTDQAVDEDWGDGWQLKSRCVQGRLIVLGFAGAAPDDHMRHLRELGSLWKTALGAAKRGDDAAAKVVRVPIDAAGEVGVADLVARLAQTTGVVIERPTGSLRLSTRGLAAGLSREYLKKALGAEVEIRYEPGAMNVELKPPLFEPAARAAWRGRLASLAAKALEADVRRASYGMRARKSYRPNDPGRPTVCLVHGMNSSSFGFVHMIPLFEEAGYGVVLHDYPFNRPIAESCKRFADDWAAFRAKTGDKLPWSIVAHSMGALVARALVEDDASWKGDARSLILIAPVNQGSYLSKAQSILQLVSGLEALKGRDDARALTRLADGVGLAANDLLPGSAFLRSLNARPRRSGLPYHILAGDAGVINRETRRSIEQRIDLATQSAGMLGKMARAAAGDPGPILDELTDQTGDGCVAVARARLAGVDDFKILHANHAELIRAPVLFADPGPVACMPDVLRWLEDDAKKKAPAAASRP